MGILSSIEKFLFGSTQSICVERSNTYRVLSSSCALSLESNVSMHIKEGWKLQSGVSVSHSKSQYHRPIFAQAVYKDLDIKENTND